MTSFRVSIPRPYVGASLATLVLTVVATVVGLFVPGLYRDAPSQLPQLYGQDLVTLAVAVPVLAIALYYTARGSLRGYVVWLGVTGYLLYTYASYAFMTAFNELYLVYVALFGVTLFTFVGGMVHLDAVALKRAVGGRSAGNQSVGDRRADDRSVRSYVAFQLAVAILVVLMWLSAILPATLDGTIPQSIVTADIPVNVIYSLDLGVLVPAFALSASWLWHGRAWGYAFTGVLLVKIATLGLAVLAMATFQILDGQRVPVPQIVIFGVLSLLGVALMARFVLSIQPGRESTSSSPATDPAEMAAGR
ncbi:hypothetical protein [Haladaptatus sp. NG-SE-30]